MKASDKLGNKHSEKTHLQAEHLPPLERLESALDLDPVLVLEPLMVQLPVLPLPVQQELELELVELPELELGLRLQRRLQRRLLKQEWPGREPW